MANKELSSLLEIENLAKLHQETFENIYAFAFKQQDGWTNSSDNTDLFNQVEQILQPFYLNWREKYNLIRQAILEEKVPYCKIVKSFVWEKRENNKELYYVSHGEDIDHDVINYHLQIRKPGVLAKSDASTLLYPKVDSCWEEKFNFFCLFNDGMHVRKLEFKIEEQTSNIKDPDYVQDKIDLHLEEEITPINVLKFHTLMPYLERSVYFSVRRPFSSDSPTPRRLIDVLGFYRLLPKEQYHKMFI